MNRKMIKLHLNRKHKEFYESIENKEIADLVKKKSIITGGCITSMLLGENINDYDYYFKDIDTAFAVADYFCEQFTVDNPKSKRNPTAVIDNDKNRINIVIASEGIAEDDSNEQFKEDKKEDKNKKKFRPVFLSSNAITLSNKIQLIIRFFGEAAEIHKNFDFVHCTNYWTSHVNKLELNPAAVESILAKELYYNGSLYPLCSVIRTRKFITRGWYINAGQYLKMCFQISRLDLSDIDVLKEQLTGVDSAYFTELIDFCKDKKEAEPNFKLTMPYVCEVVNRIFG